MSRVTLRLFTALTLGAAVVATAPTALAAAKPQAIDAWGRYENVVDIFYKATPTDWRWVPKARFYFLVAAPESDDVALVRFTANGKPVGEELKCPLQSPMAAGDGLSVVAAECMPDVDAVGLTGPAKVVAHVGYRRTSAGEDARDLATYEYEVAAHKGTNGRRELHVERDERLGEAWVHLRQDGRGVEVFSWFKEGDADATRARTGKLRCKVGDAAMVMAEQTHDRFSSEWLDATKVKDGERTGYSYNVFYTEDDGQAFMKAHPGEYRCAYTRSGELEREITFTVGEDGKPVKPPCQRGEAPLVRAPESTTIAKTTWKKPGDVAFDKGAFGARALLGRAGVAKACGF